MFYLRQAFKDLDRVEATGSKASLTLLLLGLGQLFLNLFLGATANAFLERDQLVLKCLLILLICHLDSKMMRIKILLFFAK